MTMTLNSDWLKAASIFRQAIIDANGGGYIGFTEFPMGSCGDASILLGEYLHEQGHGEWTYVSGVREGQQFQSHAWLERDGWLLDITADQFDEISESVWLTQDRSWHEQFLYAPEDELAARLHVWDEHTRRELSGVYAKIMASIRT